MSSRFVVILLFTALLCGCGQSSSPPPPAPSFAEAELVLADSVAGITSFLDLSENPTKRSLVHVGTIRYSVTGQLVGTAPGQEVYDFQIEYQGESGWQTVNRKVEFNGSPITIVDDGGLVITLRERRDDWMDFPEG